jgi:hypothetical protein
MANMQLIQRLVMGDVVLAVKALCEHVAWVIGLSVPAVHGFPACLRLWPGRLGEPVNCRLGPAKG